jgi:hypothetical protein
MLAAAYHETGRKMQPVRQVGRGKDKAYGTAEPETGQTH